MMEMIA